MTDIPSPRMPRGDDGGDFAVLRDRPPEAVLAALRAYAADGRARWVEVDLLTTRDTESAPMVAILEVADQPFREEDEDEDEEPQPTSWAALLLPSEDEDTDDFAQYVIDGLATGAGTLRVHRNGRAAYEIDGRPVALLTIGAGVVWRPEDTLDMADAPTVEALPERPIRVWVYGAADASGWEPPTTDAAKALTAVCERIEAAGGPRGATTVRIDVETWTVAGESVWLAPDLLERLARNRITLGFSAEPHRGAYLIRAAEEGALMEPPSAAMAEFVARLSHTLGRGDPAE